MVRRKEMPGVIEPFLGRAAAAKFRALDFCSLHKHVGTQPVDLALGSNTSPCSNILALLYTARGLSFPACVLVPQGTISYAFSGGIKAALREGWSLSCVTHTNKAGYPCFPFTCICSSVRIPSTTPLTTNKKQEAERQSNLTKLTELVAEPDTPWLPNPNLCLQPSKVYGIGYSATWESEL